MPYNKNMRVSQTIRDYLYLLAAWLMACLSIALNQFADPDLWGRLSVAALYFQSGRFPYFDVFSYTAPHARWIDHEWLTGIVFYQILTRLGEPCFVLFKVGMLLAILGLVIRLHRKVYQVSPLYAFYGALLLVSIYTAGFLPTIRSQSFSFLLFTVFVYILESIRLGRWKTARLVWLLPLGVLWGNLHGGVAMALLLLVCYGIAQAWGARNLKEALPYWMSALGIFSLLGVFNPYGFEYLSFLVRAWTWDRSHIGEWGSLRLGWPQFWDAQALVVGTALLLTVFGARLFRRQLQNSQKLFAPLLVLLLLMAMTLKSLRMQTFLALGLLAYAPLLLAGADLKNWLPQTWPRWFQAKASLWQNTLPVLLGIGALSGLIFLQAKVGLLHVPVADEMTQGAVVGVRYPLAALQYLRQSPYRGNLLVRFGLGEFAYWQLYPRFKVSMDGRYEEVYNQKAFLANEAFFNRHRPALAFKTAASIHQSRADFILIEADMPNLPALDKSGQWQFLYGDQYFLVYGRKSLAPYRPRQPIFTTKIMTIADFVRAADLARFKR